MTFIPPMGAIANAVKANERRDREREVWIRYFEALCISRPDKTLDALRETADLMLRVYVERWET